MVLDLTHTCLQLPVSCSVAAYSMFTVEVSLFFAHISRDQPNSQVKCAILPCVFKYAQFHGILSGESLQNSRTLLILISSVL